MILKSIQNNLTALVTVYKTANNKQINLVLKAFSPIIFMSNYKEVYDTQEAIHLNKVEQIKQEKWY